MGRKRASLWREHCAARRQNMTPHHSHHRYAAGSYRHRNWFRPTDLVLLLFFYSIESISNNLEAWIVIQYKSPCPDGALEKTIIAAANHLSFGLGSQTSTIQIKWSSKFKFANHYSFSVPPSIRLTVDENWARCLEHKQRKPVNCPN